MRRKTDKSDKWQDLTGHPFLPDEGEQAARAAAVDAQERLATLETQLNSQFTSMAAYHQIALHSGEVARAEARADLDREKAILISLVERVRDECAGNATRLAVTPSSRPDPTPSPTPAPTIEPAINVSALARIALLEDRFEQLTDQVTLCLRSQHELANSITLMCEQQMRNPSLGSFAGASA